MSKTSYTLREAIWHAYLPVFVYMHCTWTYSLNLPGWKAWSIPSNHTLISDYIIEHFYLLGRSWDKIFAQKNHELGRVSPQIVGGRVPRLKSSNSIALIWYFPTYSAKIGFAVRLIVSQIAYTSKRNTVEESSNKSKNSPVWMTKVPCLRKARYPIKTCSTNQPAEPCNINSTVRLGQDRETKIYTDCITILTRS